MENIFSFVLTITTVITGTFWCLKQLLVRTEKYLSIKINSQKLNNNSAITSLLDIIARFNSKYLWIETYTSIFPILLLVFIIRSFIFEPFQIPSGSMMPTLLVGDFILVEKFAYGIKNPITQKTFIKTGQPKRGDIVVFKYPLDNSLVYIKRIIGLPGDHISYNPINKQITIQSGYTNGQNGYRILPVFYNKFISEDFKQTTNTPSNNIVNKFIKTVPDKPKNNYDGKRYKESLVGVIHDILITPNLQDMSSIYYKQPGNLSGEWIVPLGQYFVMGDNRDNSADSRYWGFVPEKNLIGKAIAIWISFDKLESQWPTGVRLNRVGIIH